MVDDPKDNGVQSDCTEEEARQQEYTEECERLRREYLKTPTIETYVRLREENPLIDFDVSTTSGFGWIIDGQDEILSNGLDLEPVLGCLDGDKKCNEQVALALMQKIIERKEMQKAGKTHIVSRGNAINDRFVNYCIVWCLETLTKSGAANIPGALMVLIRNQLGIVGSDGELEDRLEVNRERAINAAVLLMSSGEKPTLRTIGKVLGVNASSVMRWFPDDDFDKEVRKFIDQLSELDLSLGRDK